MQHFGIRVILNAGRAKAHLTLHLPHSSLPTRPALPPPQHVQDFHMGAELIVMARYMQAIACPNIAISRHFAVLQLQIF